MRLSVRDLVEFSVPSGDSLSSLGGSGVSAGPGGSTGGSPYRPVDGGEGIRCQALVQRARPEGYRKEVPLSRVFRLGNISIILCGRADGYKDVHVCMYLALALPLYALPEYESTFSTI